MANYTAVVLDISSSLKLLQTIDIPSGWKEYAHHMTLRMGGILSKKDTTDYSHLLGKKIKLRVVAIGKDDKVIAASVVPQDEELLQAMSYFRSISDKTPKFPHITIAVNINEGGKPMMSNNLRDFKPIDEFEIEGTVEEV